MLEITGKIAGMLWAAPMVVLILGVGLLFTVGTGGVQFRRLKDMFHSVKKGGSKEVGISSLSSFLISVGGRVGTGNMAGVATAICFGGPGAVFWMWVAALIGGATSFAECTLAQIYKTKDPNGKEYRGGTTFYIEKGLNCKWLASLYAFFGICSSGFCMYLANTSALVDAVQESFGLSRILISLTVAVVFIIFVFGGIKSISSFANKLVPAMTIIFIVASIAVIFTHISALPGVFALIIKSAWNLQAGFGGMIGAAVTMGIKRGVFSNEAGQGSGTFAAGAAEVEHPAQQGLVQVLAVFVDTLVICTLTAVTILITGCYNVIDPSGTAIVSNLEGIEAGVIYLQRGVATTFGSFASIIIGICVILFTFTSILACYYQAESNMALFLKKENKAALMFVKLLGVAAILYGGLSVSKLVWNLADIACGLTVWLNLIVMLLLAKPLFITLRDYDRQRNAHAERLTFDPKALGIKGADADLWNEINHR